MRKVKIQPDEISLTLLTPEQTIYFDPLEPCHSVVHTHKACIEAYVDEDAYPDFDGEKMPLGTIAYTLVNTEAIINDRESIFDACDSYSRELLDVCNALMEEDSYALTEDVVLKSGAGDFIPKGILYIESVELKPDFRGNNLGLAAVYALLKYGAPGCDIAIIEPYPIERRGAELTPAERRKASSKLVKHYKKIGFELLRNKDFMVISMNSDNPLPPFPKSKGRR